MSNDYSVLLVDDEDVFLRKARMILLASGFTDVDICNSAKGALEMLENKEYLLLALDISMPEMTGVELLEVVSEKYPSITAIMITADMEIKTVVECMQKGAFDYVVKPINHTNLVTVFNKAKTHITTKQELLSLKHYVLNQELKHPEAFAGIVTDNPGMKSIFCYLEAIINSRLPILITGETGTGKELLAKAVHKLTYPNTSFVPVNIAGLDDNLFCDTLFGHEKGAYTGAMTVRKGLLEEAGEGTVFLDEIGDLRPESQVKLLRLLQENEYYPLGTDTPKQNNARIICATNIDIGNSASFRKDLFYRLNTHHVHLPNLCERSDDIPLLVDYFAQQSFKILKKEPFKVPYKIKKILQKHRFYGNIRELESIVFELAALSIEGEASYEYIRQKTKCDTAGIEEEQGAPGMVFGDTLPTFKEVGKILVKEALKRTDDNRTHAAKMLGITRQTLLNNLD